MSQDYFDGSMGTIWVQPEGPNTELQYLGCHDMADITQPEGDVTKRYCPSRTGAGRWTVALTSQGVPDDVTTSITTYSPKARDYLQLIANKSAKCPFPVYVHQSLCGRKDVFLSYDAATLLQNCRITQRTKSNLALREGADAAEMTFDISADNPFVEYWPLRMALLTTTCATDGTDITLCGEDRCVGPCGDTEELGDELAVGAYATTAAAAEVLFSGDAGATIAAGAADPFAATENISAVACYQSGRDAVRHFACRGTTVALTPAEIAYSDNAGVAWTTVEVGATDTEFIPWNGGIFAFDSSHIWVCTDTGAGAAGNIYFSSDGGATWTLQGTGGDALNAISFADYDVGVCVGDTNEILLTTNGGTSWSAITGPAAMAAVDAMGVAVFDRYRWQVVYEGGQLYYTFDGGASWSVRALPLPAAAASLDRLNSIHYIDDHNGVIAAKWTDGAAGIWGAIYRTTSGGTEWEVYETDEAFDTGAIGMASAVMATPNLAYAVGDITNAVTTIYRLSV